VFFGLRHSSWTKEYLARMARAQGECGEKVK
jgi:hypothetical protein